MINSITNYYFYDSLKKHARSQTFNFIKKDTLTQVFFCEYCEVFKNTYEEDLRTALFAR